MSRWGFRHLLHRLDSEPVHSEKGISHVHWYRSKTVLSPLPRACTSARRSGHRTGPNTTRSASNSLGS